ncbi:Uncharacterised protein [Alysiella crassa]|uniref:Site-specific DNA methylase n=1 Tax=Alysiella crassa TaxID=153491 RepID=A0A376BXG2_9NEIS|nr:Uncharacterised protein [Alysiella crassa]
MKFNQSPLPFTGQKRNFLKHFKHILETQIPNQGEGWTILDAFGGSGLLSHTAKQTLPKARVIYNDFDGYAERLAHIDDTNHLRRLVVAVLERENIAKNFRLPFSTRQKIGRPVLGLKNSPKLPSSTWQLWQAALNQHEKYLAINVHEI